MSGTAEVTLYLVSETDKAYQFSTYDVNEHGKARGFWIPKSIIEYIRKEPPIKDHWRECHLRIPAWKAEQLDLADESD